MKRIAILGSTGSIGCQALEVIAAHPEEFSVEVLTAHSNVALLAEQATKYQPNAVVIADKEAYPALRDALMDQPIKVFAGHDALNQIVTGSEVDLVLTALVGFAGLMPTLSAIEAGKPIALANKETLVVAGRMVTELARQKGVNIYPVDSEHSAIFQCLAGEWHNPIEKIILTASGGPFRGKSRNELVSVTSKEALRHPNWNMGAKITIDSATLMNKGLEVMEARWLFHLAPSQIEVVLHPQSIIHSMVQFADGSMKAQMGLPDMKLPIQYALSYPQRLSSSLPRFDFTQYPSLTFSQPDTETFRCLALAYEAMHTGGTMPCVLNAANEVAVAAFLRGEIGFLQIAEMIEQVMQSAEVKENYNADDLLQCDAHSRELAAEAIARSVKK